MKSQSISGLMRLAAICLYISILIAVVRGATVVTSDEYLLLPPSDVEYNDDGPKIVSGPQKGYTSSLDELWQKWFKNTLGKNWTQYSSGGIHIRVIVKEVQKKSMYIALYYFWDKRVCHGSGAAHSGRSWRRGDRAELRA